MTASRILSKFRLSFLPALSAIPLSLAAQPDGLHAGAATVDISPTVTPFQLRSGPSSHVHDLLHVRAVAFRNGEGRAAIAIIDALGVGEDLCEEAKAVAAERTGWRPEEMLVAGTHTHTAPKGGDSSPGRVAYEELRREGVAEALVRAIESLEPAAVGFASDEEASEVRNRRWFVSDETVARNPLGGYDRVRTNGPRDKIVKPAGPIDPEVAVIDVRDRRGRPLALLANYALHYVGGVPKVVEENGRTVGMASADYFGEFARLMPHRIGAANRPDYVAMMSNGASGDINNLAFQTKRPRRAPFEQIRIVATKTADAASRAAGKIEEHDSDPVVASRMRKVTLTYRQPTEGEVEKALALLELTRREQQEIHRRTPGVVRRTVEYIEPDFERSFDVDVQAMRIGDQAVVALPFEVLVEIGLELKERSPFPHTMVIGMANGYLGYLPTPEQHELGGYETWIGTARFTRDASVTLTETLLEMLEELAKREPAITP